MDSVKIVWKKQSPDKVQLFSDRQRFQQHSIQKLENQAKKLNKKIVHFNCPSTTTEQQEFENTEYNYLRTIRSQRSIFEDHDLASSPINIFATEVPIINSKPICSVRVAVITFFIVILIILAAAMAIGIVFGTIKSQQTSSGTGTGNNNRNSLSTMSTTAIVSSVSIGSQNGAPCTSYTTINDPTRNIATTGVYATCDTGSLFNASNNGSWIRFVGTGGTTIPTTSPGMYHCGGFLSGWFNNTLPTTVGIVVNGFVCFDANFYSCPIAVPISVINCGVFYAYLLPPVTVCNLRYCTI